MKEKIIKVNQENQSKLYSINHATKLYYEIDKALLLNCDKIIIDFTGTVAMSLIFFEFSLGYYLSKLGKEEFDNKFEIIGLDEASSNLYNSVYDNCIKIKNKMNKVN